MAIPYVLRPVSLAAALILGAAARPQAVPLYYSFAGQVVYSTVSDYPLGTDVTYVFRVDRDAPGYTVDGQGPPQVLGDDVEQPDYFTKYFLAQYVGGSAIPLDNPQSQFHESDYYGMEIMRYESEIYGALRGSNSDLRGSDMLEISSAEAFPENWQVGQRFVAEDVIYNGPGELNSSQSAFVTLTGIGSSNPFDVQSVPEPSAYALFGLGLLGLCLSLRGARPRRR